MPPKRKAVTQPTEPAQTRRRTRANAVPEPPAELPPPAKRTRRRTKAEEEEEQAQPEAEAEPEPEQQLAEESEQEDVEPKPRARRAPVKKATTTTKRPTRGRKVEIEPEIEPQHESEAEPESKLEVEAAPQPKRRGRAKKVLVEPEPEDDAEPEVEAAPQPKRRGRAKKVLPEPEPEPEAEAEVEAALQAEPEPNAPKRRGRPKKVQAVQDSEPEPEHALQPEVEPVPKRRGRSKKVQPEEAEESTQAVARPLSPTQGKKKAAPATTRKRGRKEADDVVEPDSVDSEPDQGTRPKRARRGKDFVGEDAPEKVMRAAARPLSERVVPTSEPEEEVQPSTPKKRVGRKAAAPAKVTKAKAKAPVPATRVPSPAKLQVVPASSQSTEDSSEDELLLTSRKRDSVRPSTPTRVGPSRGGTPRMVLHSVEITTPRHLLATLRRDVGSPGPRASAHLPPLGTPRLPAAFPSTVRSPSKRLQSPQPKLSERYVRTPSPEPAPLPPESPSRYTRRPATVSPSKRQSKAPHRSVLPEHLRPYLERQKRGILKSLQCPPEVDEVDIYGEDYPPTNAAAYEQLSDLLTGTVVRGEGNSCMLIGPSGSGKTQMVEKAIAALPSQPIIIRLSGYAQQNDRLAIREIAWQLAQQTGQSFLPNDPEDGEDGEDADAAPPQQEQEPAAPEAENDVDDEVEDDEENPFVERAAAPAAAAPIAAAPIISLPPPSHLLALISMIPTLPLPTVLVLDGFDLFAKHARQALLYCLLDTAQACRTGTGAGSGMAVVGVTARVDTINLLEKRVKSRFSGRMIRTACPAKMEHWVALAKATLSAPVVGEGEGGEDEGESEWRGLWEKAVEAFLEDDVVVEVLQETYALTRDFQMFRRIMTSLALELRPESPYPSRAALKTAVSRQRCPSRYPSLHTLPYPSVCLLIASVHAHTSGHDVFTFEMLYDAFRTQMRTSQSAPVQIEGGGIGMVRCSREVLFSAFERLVDLHIFSLAAAPAVSVAKEFALHRSAVDKVAVKKAVDTIGQLNLKKWLTKA